MSFIKKMFNQATKNESESGKKVNHVVVEIEITEHEYMALDGDDEMVGGESFVFNGDESPDFIRITVDGNEIEFDEDELSDRSKYSDYEPFDMEEKWDSEDIAKFGYYDNIAGKTWEFDVEDFDIEKLSFYYQCFDVKFGPADYDSEEHRITLRYDEAEIEEDFDAYSCENGEFEQEWCLYDDEDDDECSYEEEDEEEEENKNCCLEDTDALWAAVIENLPEEIKANVSAPKGKAYIHIKPKNKHLGVKDFKYCVEYSKKSSSACVNIETLNGGEEAKATIQQFINEKEEKCIVKSAVAQQGVKNKNKWKWEVTTSAEELNGDLVKWYVETINAFWSFFETSLDGTIDSQTTDEEDRVALKEYIQGLEYTFEEFDMDDCDGSYFTNWGTLDELFDDDQLDEAFENVCWFDEETKDWMYLDETHKYLDQVTEDIIEELLSELTSNLNQGAIKDLEIKDGDKVIYKVSNDEPYED